MFGVGGVGSGGVREGPGCAISFCFHHLQELHAEMRMSAAWAEPQRLPGSKQCQEQK